MTKTETPEKLQKRKAREAKELERLLKSRQKPVRKLYPAYLLMLLSLTYIADEVASNIDTMIKSGYVNEFFVKGMGLGFNEGLGKTGLVTIGSIVVILPSLFYKTLADRYGRKIFLAVNTFGIGGSLFFCFLSGSFNGYLAAMMFVNFFITLDVHVMFISETVDAKHRGKTFAIIKGLAILSVLVVSVSRDLFLEGDDTAWRRVFLIPAVLGMAAGLLALLTARETDVFLNARISFLQKTDEERRIEQEVRKKDQSEGGLFHALKFCMQHKQLRYMLIISFLFLLGFLATKDYEAVMASKDISIDGITNALYLLPVANSIMTVLVGFVSDRFGRRPGSILSSATALVFFVLFCVGVLIGWSVYVLGVFLGLFLGGFWTTSDTFGLMVCESAPTNIRASVVSAHSIAGGLGILLSTVIGMVVLPLLPEKNNIPLYLLLIIPCVSAAIALLVFKVRETKNTDLSTVTGNEFDETEALS